MAEEVYSAQIREHLEHPRNAGPMESPDAIGVQGNPICGDTMKLMLRISGDRVTEARWQTVGCQPALATSSIATELVIGKSIAEVAALTQEDILSAVGGLPASKMHCSSMAADALRKAVAGYQSRRGQQGT